MSTQRKFFETLSACVDHYVARGYTADFLIPEDKNCLICVHNNQELAPEEFEIDEIYRFEGMTDPEDSSIVFAISSKDNSIKGLVINGYGATFSSKNAQLVEHLMRHV